MAICSCLCNLDIIIPICSPFTSRWKIFITLSLMHISSTRQMKYFCFKVYMYIPRRKTSGSSYIWKFINITYYSRKKIVLGLQIPQSLITSDTCTTLDSLKKSPMLATSALEKITCEITLVDHQCQQSTYVTKLSSRS